MSRVREFIAEFFDEGDEAICLDGLDDAVLGAGIQHGSPPRLVYDRDLILRILVERDGMSHEEADEFCGFNIDCLYAGPGTPIILHRILGEEERGEYVSFSVDEGDPVARWSEPSGSEG